MNVVIRADASEKIGSGHVMRCLTLADALREKGNNITFICRILVGDMITFIREKGYVVKTLPSPDGKFEPAPDEIEHAEWLGLGWEQDAEQTSSHVVSDTMDWLVVDHYGLDYRWHGRLRSKVKNILVIDDLADRRLDCDILLDQNLIDDMVPRYLDLVPRDCIKLLGPQYALLRPEFRVERNRVTARQGQVRRILVFFGGADPADETTRVLHVLDQLDLHQLVVDVVVGSANRQSQYIQEWCAQRSHVNYHCQVSNIAELMGLADLGLGASGVATWERCALMLPAIVVAVAYNQEAIAEAVAAQGVVEYLGRFQDIGSEDWAKAILKMLDDPVKLNQMSEACGTLIDCEGAPRVVAEMMEL